MKNKFQKFDNFFKNNLEKSRFLDYFLPTTCCILLSFFCIPIHAQKSGAEIDEQRRKVEEAFIPNVFVQSTVVIESSEDIPKHVLIRGYTMPSNYFQIRMPLDAWNEKNFIAGCGAGCGTLPTDISGKLKIALQRGYVTTTMNTGHWSPSTFDFSWAYNNPQAEIEYAYRAVHESQRASKELIKIFYGEEPRHSYFWGCSGGGRQALMAASRYPQDFDGIIAEAPALDYTGELLLLVWLRQTNTGPDGKDILTKEDVPLISRLVYETCDNMDGLADGLISTSDPCPFDPEILTCEDRISKDCLSREKVEVLRKWYQGPVDSKGDKLFTSGVALGSEPYWGLWLLGGTNEPLDELLNSESMLKYTAFQEDPVGGYSVFDFDFDLDPARMRYMGNLLNVNHLSLDGFKKEGGKLLMFHGLADPAIPFHSSVDYYEKNYAEFGEDMVDFFRFFLIPGMDHCTALSNLGITESSVDPLAALENWIEKDQAPHELPVIRYTDNGSEDSRFIVPLYLSTKQ